MSAMSLDSITPRQRWYAACTGVAVLILLAGFFLLIHPRMSKPGDLNNQAQDVQMQVSAERAKLAGLQHKAAELPAEQRIAKAIEQKFPATADQNDLLTQISDAVTASGLSQTSVSGLTLGVPTLQVGTGKGVSVPANNSPAQGPAAQPPAAAGSTQVASMSVSMTVSAPRAQLVAFLKQLENAPRAFLVTSVSIGSASTGGSGAASATISGTMFVVPGPAAASPH